MPGIPVCAGRSGRGRLRRLVAATVALVVVTGLTGCGQYGLGGGKSGGACDIAPNYPRGPIQLVVPWAAGGGTDAVARFVGDELASSLGAQVNVVNQDGGGGVVGHSTISIGRPDGSTIGMVTIELAMMHWLGLTELDYRKFTPLGQVNADPAGITVSKDAPWDDANALLDDIAENAGKLTASGTSRGGIWDLARAGMLDAADLPADALRWVPSDGAAPALQELAAGGVDVSTTSLVENRSMLEKGGKAKALAIMADERDPQFPDVPTLKEQGTDFTMRSWRGIAGPIGMDEKIAAELECHLKKIVDGKSYRTFMSTAGYQIVWRDAEEFGSYLADQDKELGGLMKATGLTK